MSGGREKPKIKVHGVRIRQKYFDRLKLGASPPSDGSISPRPITSSPDEVVSSPPISSPYNLFSEKKENFLNELYQQYLEEKNNKRQIRYKERRDYKQYIKDKTTNAIEELLQKIEDKNKFKDIHGQYTQQYFDNLETICGVFPTNLEMDDFKMTQLEIECGGKASFRLAPQYSKQQTYLTLILQQSSNELYALSQHINQFSSKPDHDKGKAADLNEERQKLHAANQFLQQILSDYIRTMEKSPAKRPE